MVVAMTINLSQLTWHDFILIGVIIGLWLGQRWRTKQGERIGRIEELLFQQLGITKATDNRKDGNDKGQG